MSNQCAAPQCENAAPFGTLCAACESVWLTDRREVIAQAERLTDLAAQFQRYCADHNQPNPYD